MLLRSAKTAGFPAHHETRGKRSRRPWRFQLKMVAWLTPPIKSPGYADP
jgi:hypothetical protein